MTKSVFGLFIFLLLQAVTSYAQEESIFKPALSLNYTHVPTASLIDSTGTYSSQVLRAGFSIPIWSNFNRNDTLVQSTIFHLSSNSAASFSNPKLSNVLENQYMLGASIGMSGILIQNQRNIFSIALSALTRNDFVTLSSPQIRYSGIALYRRRVSASFSYRVGAAYSYLFGRGIAFPVLGLSVKTGKQSRLLVNFPNRISFVKRVGKRLVFNAYLQPQGGFNFISNQTNYLNGSEEFYLRQRENQLGLRSHFKLASGLRMSTDIGWMFRRKISISQELNRKTDLLYNTAVKSGMFYGLGLKYVFQKTKRKTAFQYNPQKTDILLSEPEMDDLLIE